MRHAGQLASLFMLSLASLAAWSNPPVEVQGASSSPPASASEGLTALKAPPIEVVSIPRLIEVLQAKRGKVVVANFWATWCAPCLEEMPELVRFYRSYRPKGVVFLSVSADHPDDLAGRIKPYLEREKIPFPVYVVGGESPDELVAAIDPRWQGSLPATFMFDTAGEMQHAWYDKVTLEELAKAVNSLLPQVSPADSDKAPSP